MNWELSTQGYFHKFKMSSNELIISCWDYNNSHVGTIKIILNDKERRLLRDLLK